MTREDNDRVKLTLTFVPWNDRLWLTVDKDLPAVTLESLDNIASNLRKTKKNDTFFSKLFPDDERSLRTNGLSRLFPILSAYLSLLSDNLR